MLMNAKTSERRFYKESISRVLKSVLKSSTWLTSWPSRLRPTSAAKRKYYVSTPPPRGVFKSFNRVHPLILLGAVYPRRHR